MMQLTFLSGKEGFNRVLACQGTFLAQLVCGALELAGLERSLLELSGSADFAGVDTAGLGLVRGWVDGGSPARAVRTADSRGASQLRRGSCFDRLRVRRAERVP